VNTFFSTVNFFPEVCYAKKAVSAKYECVLPYSLDRCCLGYLTNDALRDADPNTNFIETHEYFTKEQIEKIYKDKGRQVDIKNYATNLTVNTAHISFGFPFNPRVYRYGGAFHFDKKERVLTTILKSYFDENTDSLKTYKTKVVTKLGGKKVDAKAYPLFNYMITVYKQIDENKVLFSQVNVCDASGWTNHEAVHRPIVKARGYEFRNTLHKVVSEMHPEKTIESCKEDLCKEVEGKVFNGLGKLLFDAIVESNDV
jgi:hypothetical protein